MGAGSGGIARAFPVRWYGVARLRSSVVSAGLALVANAATGHAAPVHCPLRAGASLSLGAMDAQTRLAWIDARLSEAGSRSRSWAWIWGSGIATSGIASLVAVPFVRARERVDWYTSAVTAAVGVLPLVLTPPRVIRDSRELHAKLLAAPPGPSPQDLCPLLAGAEARFAGDAEDQRQQQVWWLHVANFGFNVGVALFLGLGYGHWSAGIINGGSGAVVGEAILFTQPTATIDDLQAYRAGDIGPLEAKGTAFFRFSTAF